VTLKREGFNDRRGETPAVSDENLTVFICRGEGRGRILEEGRADLYSRKREAFSSRVPQKSNGVDHKGFL